MNKLIEKRLKTFQETLTDKKIEGAIVSSKHNFLYMLGFKTESPAYLYIPSSSSKTEREITIFTNTLEEQIVKKSNPLKSIETFVLNKTLPPANLREFEKGNFKEFEITDSNQKLRAVLVPNNLLNDLMDNQFKSNKQQILKTGQTIDKIEIKPQTLIQNALQKNAIMINEWSGRAVIVPGIRNLRAISEFINHGGSKLNIGIEFEAMNYGEAIKLEPFSKKNISPLLEMQRMIKDKEEIKILKKAAKIGELGWDAAQNAIHEQSTENDAQAEAEYAMKKAGSSAPSFETIVVSGYKSALPHGHAGDKQIKHGELVTVDLGATYMGYASDMTRTVLSGHEGSEKLKKIYRQVQHAHKLGVDSIAIEASWADSDIAVRKYFDEIGRLEYYVHSLGHGVGVEVHEAPWINYKQIKPTQKLKAGMVFTIEPGLYIPDLGGVRIEDTLHILEDGSVEYLTNSTYADY